MAGLTDSQVFAFWFGAPLVLAACIGSGLSCAKMHQTSASLDWPATSGKVVERFVAKVRHCKKSGSTDCSWVYSPAVEYSYLVDGQEYRSTRVSLEDAPAFGSEEAARAASAKERAIQEVTVHYDPSAPGQAVLEPSTSDDVTFYERLSATLAVAAALLLGGALVVFVRPMRERRRLAKELLRE